MKKLFLVGVLIIVFCFCGCSNSNLHNSVNTNQEILKGKNTDGVVLPNAKLSDFDLEKCITKLPNPNFHIIDILGEHYYGAKSKQVKENIEDEYLLVDANSNTQKFLNYQTGTEDWIVGSGSAVIMQNRYHYEWKSYTSEMSDESLQDVKLIRTDGRTGNVEIIDEVKQSSPFIYLCKIDEEHFLSFGTTQAPSKKTEYAVISSASIYNVNGDKKEIINEKYENNESWSDSEGILIEHFTVNHGELYGYGRRQINKEYKHFLYHYDLNGKLINQEQLNGFEKIIGEEQPVDFIYIGDYIAFKTYESMSNYVCKINENGVELIMRGIDGQIQYTVVDKYILFIEENVDAYADKIKDIDCPLYILDTSSGSIKAVRFKVPIENPYFYSVSGLSDNSVILSYCENEYEPLEIYQFLIKNESVKNIMD